MIRPIALIVQYLLLAVADPDILVLGFDRNHVDMVVLLALCVTFALCCITFGRIVMHLARPTRTLWPVLPKAI